MLPVPVQNITGAGAEITGSTADYYNFTSADAEYYWRKL
jgi:hypothetical protein